MGSEISQNFNQFAKHFNQLAKDQELSPADKTALQQDIEKVQTPEQNLLAQAYLDQAVLQSASGIKISPVPLMHDALMEVDMHFDAKDQTIVPIGSIHLKQEMMQQLIEKLLKDSLNMKDVSFAFNPANESYTIKGKYAFDYLPDPAFSLTLKPSVEGSQLKFKIQDLQYPGPKSDTLANLVLASGAKVLNDEGLTASFSKESRSIALDLNAVLHKVTPLPGNMAIDFKQVTSSTISRDNGNLEVVFAERGKAPATGLDTTTYSDLHTSLNTGALKNLLNTALKPELEIKAASVEQGKLKLEALAYSPELKALGEGADILSALMGGPSIASRGQIPITLILEPRDGNKLYFASSLATGTVAEQIAKLGPTVEKDAKGAYYVNFEKLLKAEEGSIKTLTVTADGIDVESHLNIDHFLQK